MANVILLRTPSHDTHDPYEEAFKSKGYHPSSVPVLETSLVNLEDLALILLESPSAEGYTGVIITSARACEAWNTVATRLLAETQRHTQVSTAAGSWSALPFYVVGMATAKALGALRDTHGQTGLTPLNICGATESGTGERLAHFVLLDLRRKGVSQPKLLCLTGDKNRDTLPDILRGGGVQMKFLQVYETHCSASFASELEAVVNAAAAAAATPAVDQRWWIVFFAPSAAQRALPALREWFDDIVSGSDEKAQQRGGFRAARVAAIGPTTAAFLGDELDIRVDVVASRPTPSDLADAVVGYDCGLG